MTVHGLAVAWLIAAGARAAPATLVFDGAVPDDGYDHFFVPFEVPAGVAEIEVRHDDLSDEDILDWGLYDPDGHRGWGGGNTEPAVLNADAASRSYTPGPITPGTWQVVVGKAKLVSADPRYHIEVDLRDAITLPAQPERTPYVEVAPLEVGARWYAGDLHVHSLESGDATASLDAIADWAAGHGLDFVVVTDHNTVSHLDWLLDAQMRHPDVLLVPGTEFTTYDGHMNAFGVSAWVDHKLGLPGVTLDAALAAYAAQGALVSINHPALDLGPLCIGCAWTQEIPADALAAIEIGTGGWDVTGSLFTPDAIALWDGLCADGHPLAAVGGSDDHRAGTDTGPFASPIGSPTTLVWAEALSASAILDGIAAGRTVVKLQGPDDPMVALDADGLTVSATATGAAGATLAWIVDGVATSQIPVDADPFTATLGEADGIRDGVRVRAELRVDGDPRTVTSHVWPTAGPAPTEDAGGCGCASGGPIRVAAPGVGGLAAGFGAFGAFAARRGRARSPAGR